MVTHTSAPVNKSLPEAVTQLQAMPTHTEPKLLIPPDVKQAIGPRIENEPIPCYPDLILRPPPRPPDLRENRTDLAGFDMGKKQTLKRILLTKEEKFLTHMKD